MNAVKGGKIKRKARLAKGVQDIYVTLGEKTIERYKQHFTEGDYAAIARDVQNPPTTRANVGALLKAAAENINTRVPKRIATAITDFYRMKEEVQAELNK